MLSTYEIKDVPIAPGDREAIEWAAEICAEEGCGILSLHLKMIVEAIDSAPGRMVEDG